jgi:hypothetical protein
MERERNPEQSVLGKWMAPDSVAAHIEGYGEKRTPIALVYLANLLGFAGSRQPTIIQWNLPTRVDSPSHPATKE